MSFGANGIYTSEFANIPLVSTGRWHFDGAGSAAQGPTIVVDRAYAVPLWPGRECTLTDVCMNVGAAFSSPGTIRGGLYAADALTGLPSSLITDASTFVEATGTKSWGSLTNLLAPILYFWVVTAQDGTGGTPTWSSRNWSNPLISEANASPPNPNTQRSAYYSDTGFTGAYPAAFGAVAGIVVGPSLGFKLT